MSNREDCQKRAPIVEHLDEIRALCREFGVKRLEVFGSVCTEEFDPERSDVDFLVEYPEGYEFGPWGHRLMDLDERLADILGRSVDLVMVKAIRNPWFKRLADQTRTAIYEGTQIAIGR